MGKKSTVAIEINNNKAQFHGSYETLNTLYEAFRIRHPNAFHMRNYMPKGWDGKIDVMSKKGSIELGLLPKFITKMDELGIRYEIGDHRPPVEVPKVIAEFNGYTLRDYQESSLRAVVEHHIKDSTGDIIPFHRGILKEATNAGKTLMAAGLFLSFNKLPTLMFINGTDLYEQALKEMPGYIGAENVGRIDPKEIKLAPFTLVKVRTLANRLDKLKRELIKYRVGIIDECDQADNKTYKRPLSHLINLSVRVGMSGTAQMGKLKKHEPKKIAIEGAFGPIIHETTNRDLIDKGHSMEVVVKINKGNDKVYEGLTYQEEYDECIVFNKNRNRTILKRLNYNCVKKKRIPALVICQRLDHVQELYKMSKKHFKKEYRVAYATGQMKTKKRKQIIEDFREGKIDILITSMIISRGMNLPLTQFLINAAGGESAERPLQILGRLFRKLEGIKYKYYEDFWDEGQYLRHHSRRRRLYYEDEDLVVLPLF
tara:strand:+ start:78 stop:1529 length:1452 start_codon:yes stop_codon:yes gene_type:complete